MELMSGGRPPLAPPANGAPCASVGAALGAALDASLDARPNRCPATSAMSATSAIAATLQGSALEKPRWSFAPDAVPPAPAGVPHR